MFEARADKLVSEFKGITSTFNETAGVRLSQNRY